MALHNTTQTLTLPDIINIVSVTPTENVVSLTWMLSSRCNYDCMYCPSYLHDATSVPPTLAVLKKAWQRFLVRNQSNAPIRIGFTGGEVTAIKSFLPFVSWLRASGSVDQIMLTTNGSASKQYYLKLCSVVNAISFSVHSEFFNEKKFFGTVEACNAVMIRPFKSVHVNIMNEHWNYSRIALYEQWLTDRNISYSVNEISYENQIRSAPVNQGVYNLDT